MITKLLLSVRSLQARRPRRKGAIMSMELVLVLPILIGLLLAIVEFSMIWSASQLVKQAASAGCRTATFQGSDMPAIRHAVEVALQKNALIQNYRLSVQGGPYSGDEVTVTIEVPMQAASPDLLGILGFRLAGRKLGSQTVMRRE